MLSGYKYSRYACTTCSSVADHRHAQKSYRISSARLEAKRSTVALALADIVAAKKSHLPSPTSDPLTRQTQSKAPASDCEIEGATGHSPSSEVDLPSAQLTHHNRTPVSFPSFPSVQQEHFPSRKRRLSHTSDRSEPSTKRLRPSSTHPNDSAPGFANEEPIHYWIKHDRWPKRLFDCNTLSQRNPELEQYFEEGRGEDWYKEEFKAELEARDGVFPTNNMSYLLARRRSLSTLRCQSSEPSLATPSDQKPREGKGVGYATSQYETLLETKGSFMRASDLNITEISSRLCRDLLEKDQMVPSETLFHDDWFERTCENLQARNEAMVIRDIGDLIVPPAQTLATRGATHLRVLTESVNEGWNSSIPVTKTRPQPDYSVGFGRSAFTRAQLERLRPFVGDMEDAYFTYFMVTYRMFFPFLTGEVKCGYAALDIADRQNAHSMIIAVRAVVELYKNAQWEEGFDWKQEIHRQILAFSISHDHDSVRIYGHYPVLDGRDITYFRHVIKKFSFRNDDGKEKWTAYMFVKNVYDFWMPKHLERLRKAIDALPTDLNFEVSAGLSFNSITTTDVESEQSDSQEFGISAPSSHETAGFKRPRLGPTAILRDQISTLIRQQQEQQEKMEQQREEMERQRREEREEMERQRREDREEIRGLMALLQKKI